ncbi:MAG: DUF1211 domain-containing protein [Proteobacteria bacterium]|nr:DUF1211 domain-containing protein [Pseudomonadota bacterium]
MPEPNANARLEAFCDGVFAIALTLLIIDIRIPSPESIGSTAELWRAVRHLAPAISAFVLSFGIILITWVNHHGFLQLVRGATASFIYANGFLLLTVVILPFPTAMLGDFLLTDHAAPAVVLYDAVLAANAIGWMLMSRAALTSRLTPDELATARMRENGRNGRFALMLYSVLAVAAIWIPVTVAVVTLLSWLFWLVLGIRLKRS